VGVAIVTDQSNCGNPIRRDATGPWQEFASLLAEPYIAGRTDHGSAGRRGLLVTELVPQSGFYDFTAKYSDGMTEHVCPAQIPDNIAKLSATCAGGAPKAGLPRRLAPATSAGMTSAARTDCFCWRQHPAGHDALSLVPEQARHCGISYAELVEIIIADALRFYGKLA